MFKRMFVVVCMALMCAVTACSQKRPSEIRTYRELLNYSASAMKAYKGAPFEYASLLKDLITIMGDEADEEIEKGDAITNLSDKDEIEDMVFIVLLVAESASKKFSKYENVDEKLFFDTLEKALISYAK